MRQQFELPEEDEAGLKARGCVYETVKANNAMFLIVPDYIIPSGYNVQRAGLLLRIPSSYPDEQIDMAYFTPTLSLLSGKTIRQLSSVTLDNKPYQQWSRHRTLENPWRPGLDNICTHLVQVDNWLERELVG